MKSLYLIPSKESSLNDELKALLAKKHKKLAVFSPIVSDAHKGEVNFSFKKTEAIRAYAGDKNAFLAKIIADFEGLKKQNDLVFVTVLEGLDAFGNLEFNVALAKELNAPLCVQTSSENKDLVASYLKSKLGNAPFSLITSKEDLGEIDKLKDYDFITPNRFRFELTQNAKKDKKTVVLPESDDDRIIEASAILLEEDAVKLILLGDENDVKERAKKLNVNLKGVEILNPKNSSLNDEFAKTLYEARKEKGLSEDEAKQLVKDRTYFGTLLVHTKRADAMVSGASTTTAETIRPALQLIKTKEGVSVVSGAFFMSLEDRLLFFADCAVTPNPTPEQVAEIAYTSAITAKAFGLEPKVAILSYSTGESGSGVSVDATKEALKVARQRYPELLVDGPLQFDAAIDPKTAKSKMPNSKVAGEANVFIFPDLNAANIAYKAVQRTANAIAIGPVLQGLKKPVNDLSRGCLVDDIVNTVILSAIQAKDN